MLYRWSPDLKSGEVLINFCGLEYPIDYGSVKKS